MDTVSVLGRDEGYTVKYSPEAQGLYLSVYPKLTPNTGSKLLLRIIMLKIPSFISLTAHTVV